jgi:hypothetical protein
LLTGKIRVINNSIIKISNHPAALQIGLLPAPEAPEIGLANQVRVLVQALSAFWRLKHMTLQNGLSPIWVDDLKAEIFVKKIKIQRGEKY